MEQYKWEEEFKEQLNSREIKPSENAWAKLDAMLSAAEKPKKKFPWMYVAASFVGFLLIGTVYFSQKTNTIDVEKNEVVIQNNTIGTKHDKKPLDILNTNANRIKGKIAVTVSKKSRNPELRKETVVVKDSSSQNQEIVSINNQINESEPIQAETHVLTVDELLARASKKIRANNKANTNLTIHVNANNLLLQTDGELEPAFRQSMFSKVVDNLKTVKVVINREEE